MQGFIVNKKNRRQIMLGLGLGLGLGLSLGSVIKK